MNLEKTLEKFYLYLQRAGRLAIYICFSVYPYYGPVCFAEKTNRNIIPDDFFEKKTLFYLKNKLKNTDYKRNEKGQANGGDPMEACNYCRCQARRTR